jgi:predicted phosphodiesterase
VNRFAVVSDIHGNIFALEAVLADMANRRVEAVINLGDNLSGPLWPVETGKLLMQQSWFNIQGNHDWNLLHEEPQKLSRSDYNAYQSLDADLRAWLNTLSPILTLPEGILAFHGTPAIKNGYLLESTENGRVRLATPAEISQSLEGAAASLLLCGHSHTPRTVEHKGMLIVNPGSLGCPAYVDNSGSSFVVETGSTHARYTILEKRDTGWLVEHLCIPYDYQKAVEMARRNARPDWEIALRSGYMREWDETPVFPPEF